MPAPGAGQAVASAPAPWSLRRAYGSCDPQQMMDARLVVEELLCRAGVDDTAGVEDDHVLCDAADHGEVLLDEQHRALLADALERARHLGHEQRREALGRLVDQQ